jgi:hypothetical protein
MGGGQVKGKGGRNEMEEIEEQDAERQVGGSTEGVISAGTNGSGVGIACWGDGAGGTTVAAGE